MIVYKDVLSRLKDSGYSTYRLMKEGLISQTTLYNIRHNKPISSTTIDVICSLAKCQPGDILEYVEAEEEPTSK